MIIWRSKNVPASKIISCSIPHLPSFSCQQSLRAFCSNKTCERQNIKKVVTLRYLDWSLSPSQKSQMMASPPNVRPQKNSRPYFSGLWKPIAFPLIRPYYTNPSFLGGGLDTLKVGWEFGWRFQRFKDATGSAFYHSVASYHLAFELGDTIHDLAVAWEWKNWLTLQGPTQREVWKIIDSKRPSQENMKHFTKKS